MPKKCENLNWKMEYIRIKATLRKERKSKLKCLLLNQPPWSDRAVSHDLEIKLLNN